VHQPKLNQLLRKAALRKQVASNVGRFYRAFIAVTIGLFCLLLIARLFGVIPDFFKPTYFWVIPTTSAIVALTLYRKLAPAHVAREVDERAGSKDLFLTAIATASMQQEFGQLVQEQAETRAEKTDIAALFPFHWQRGAARMLVSSLLLIAGTLWLPQFDPFKFNEKRQEFTKKEERLEATKIATTMRKAELTKEDKRTSEHINTALAELNKTFKTAKPLERELNERKLNEQARNLNDYWKRLSPTIPKADMQSASQKFGANQKDIQKMVDQLKKGDASELNKEIQNLLDQAKKAAAATDPAARKEQMEKLAKQLADLSNQLKEQLGSKEINDALSRAMEQMDLSNSLSADGASGASESLQLSQEEMARLAEAFKDMQNMEDALKSLQMARQLNQMSKLSGEACGNCNSFAAYAAMYQQMLSQNKGGQGQSGPNPGQAFGGSVGENDFTNTNFETQKTNAQITAGKMLMEWKDKGVGETGERGDYKEAVEAVKQSVSEAIRNEKVPAGYHSTIQKYFDSLPEKR